MSSLGQVVGQVMALHASPGAVREEAEAGPACGPDAHPSEVKNTDPSAVTSAPGPDCGDDPLEGSPQIVPTDASGGGGGIRRQPRAT